MEKKASVGKIHMTAKERNDRMFAGALLLPSVLITVIFILIPVADSVVKSFLSYKVKNIISGTPGELFFNHFISRIDKLSLFGFFNKCFYALYLLVSY